MQGGPDDENPDAATAEPATADAVPGPPPPEGPDVFSEPATPPLLPHSDAKVPERMNRTSSQVSAGAGAWYRSDDARRKSVHRRANPWYRQTARGVVFLVLVSALAIGLYLGADQLQGFLGRDHLPDAGAEVPEIRATSFQMASASPAPALDGTLTIDASTRAFEFSARAGGVQAGYQAISVDGSVVYLRRNGSEWSVAGPADTIATDLRLAVQYLSDDDTADDILTNRLRRGFADLVEQTDEGSGSNHRTRYQIDLDTQRFADDFPLEWQDFQRTAIPAVVESPSMKVVMWLDDDDVLVRFEDSTTMWTWQRLTYSDQSFTPPDPGTTATGGPVATTPDESVPPGTTP